MPFQESAVTTSLISAATVLPVKSRLMPGVRNTEATNSPVTSSLNQSRVQIRIVHSEAEREMVFQFRYAIYVEEMHRAEPHADHRNRRIEEPLDQDGALFGAFRGEKIVGTLRMNSGQSVRGYYENLYGMNEYTPYFPQRTSITTKLMILPSLRKSSLSFRIVETGFRYALENNFKYDFIDCNQHLKAYFIKLGYQPHLPDIDHPVYGEVSRLLLDFQDWEHLKRMRSPFYRLRSTQ